MANGKPLTTDMALVGSDQGKANKKVEDQYIANLKKGKSFTGTYQSSAGKSQAVLDAEKEYRPLGNPQSAEAQERYLSDEQESKTVDAINALDNVGDFSQRKNLDTIAMQLGMSPEGAYGFLNKYGNLSVLDQNFDPSQMGTEVDPTTRAYGKGFTEANIDNADLDKKDRDNLARQGGLASFNVQNMLSNLVPSGFLGPQQGQGIAGLEAEPVQPTGMESLKSLFSNENSAEMMQTLQSLLGMIQGFPGMEKSTGAATSTTKPKSLSGLLGPEQRQQRVQMSGGY
jgi:hypothetical protein